MKYNCILLGKAKDFLEEIQLNNALIQSERFFEDVFGRTLYHINDISFFDPGLYDQLKKDKPFSAYLVKQQGYYDLLASIESNKRM